MPKVRRSRVSTSRRGEYRFDLSRVDELDGLVSMIERESVPIDVLCSVAGVFEPAGLST